MKSIYVIGKAIICVGLAFLCYLPATGFGVAQTGPEFGDFRYTATAPDNDFPSVAVTAPTLVSAHSGTESISFTVGWQGYDTTSGVADYDVQYRVDPGGSWTDWLTYTAVISATFGPHAPVTVQAGHVYAFRARAWDHTGNVGAWGGSGYPDLAVGNRNQPNRVYHNDGGTLALAWSSAESDDTPSVAWGDWDADGDLDLAAGNANQPNRVYRNDSGTLTLAWSSAESDNTYGVPWGDWDGDGDLDLAAGNYGQPNRVYRNDGGVLALAWSSAESDNTYGVAWGDWDGDGDPDLAVGNYGPDRVYRNEGGTLILAWSSTEGDDAKSVAWGDWDGDGDPDLAVGNCHGQPNRVYRNDGGTLSLAWSSPEHDESRGVAWGDWDGDGDLDLAVANYGPNRVYRNDGGTLVLAWSSTESDSTVSVDWGDWDRDGDLDLAVGNYDGQPNRVYRNDGGTLTLAWSSDESEYTSSVAWQEAAAYTVVSLVEDTDYYVYLPLIARDHVSSLAFPLHIGDAVLTRPVAYRGEVFYSKSVQLPHELPAGGHFYLSSQPDVAAEALVDDELVVLVDGAEVYAYDFSTSGHPVSTTVEVPRATMELLVGRTITIEYRDVYGDVIGASPMWLIWTSGGVS